MPDEQVSYWKPGDVVVLRYYETLQTARMVHAYMGDPAVIYGTPFLAGGVTQTVMARPYVVVEDTPAVAALYQPAGAPIPRWHVAEQRLIEDGRTTRGRSLRLLYPGKAYDVTLFFESDDSPPWYYDALFGEAGLQAGWRENRDVLARTATDAPPGQARSRFRGWYVNMQTPFHRAGPCFDIADQVLDIVVRPDLSWYWKDEDELEICLAAGAITETEAEEIRAAGQEAVALIEARAAPFDGSWSNWTPSADVTIRAEDIPDGWQVHAGYAV